MSKKLKITLYIASGLILLGGILWTIGFFQGGYREISGIDSSVKAEDLINDENMALESFDSIASNIDIGDVSVKRGDSYGIALTNYTKESLPKYEVKDGVLTVTSPQLKQRISLNNINMPYYGVSITIPKDKDMSSVVLNSKDGDIFVNALKANTIEINCDYGGVELSNIDAPNLAVTTDSGAINMNGITAATTTVNSEYGDLNLSDCTGTTFTITQSNGECKLDTLNVENINITSNDGDIEIGDISGKTLNATSDSSDIILTTVNIEDTVVELEYGKLSVNSINGNSLTVNNADGDILIAKGVLQGVLNIKTNSGSIEVTEMETKGLDIKNSWGSVDLEGDFLGKSDIEAESGDISIKTKTPKDLYSYAIKTQDYGEIRINGEKVEGTLIVKIPTENQINIIDESGDISIDFGK